MLRVVCNQSTRCQFHWWSYDVPYYLDALNHLQDMKAEGKIRHVGLTNFDTKHLQYVMDKGVQIASNQVTCYPHVRQIAYPHLII